MDNSDSSMLELDYVIVKFKKKKISRQDTEKDS